MASEKMHWFETEDEILDRLEEMLFHHGYPLQDGYITGYTALFLNAYRIGGPMGDQIRDVMFARGAADNEHARTNVPALASAWSNWWALLEATVMRKTLSLGPRGPYDDF
jgi:hypothetical protein